MATMPKPSELPKKPKLPKLPNKCPVCRNESLVSTLILQVPVKAMNPQNERATFYPQEEMVAGEHVWCKVCSSKWTWGKLFRLLRKQGSNQNGEMKKNV